MAQNTRRQTSKRPEVPAKLARKKVDKSSHKLIHFNQVLNREQKDRALKRVPSRAKRYIVPGRSVASLNKTQCLVVGTSSKVLKSRVSYKEVNRNSVEITLTVEAALQSKAGNDSSLKETNTKGPIDPVVLYSKIIGNVVSQNKYLSGRSTKFLVDVFKNESSITEKLGRSCYRHCEDIIDILDEIIDKGNKEVANDFVIYYNTNLYNHRDDDGNNNIIAGFTDALSRRFFRCVKARTDVEELRTYLHSFFEMNGREIAAKQRLFVADTYEKYVKVFDQVEAGFDAPETYTAEIINTNFNRMLNNIHEKGIQIAISNRLETLQKRDARKAREQRQLVSEVLTNDSEQPEGSSASS